MSPSNYKREFWELEDEGGGVGDGTSDDPYLRKNHEAFNKVVKNASHSPYPVIRLRKGRYFFSEPPAPIKRPIRIEGLGQTLSQLVLVFDKKDRYQQGFFHINAERCSVARLAVVCNKGLIYSAVTLEAVDEKPVDEDPIEFKQCPDWTVIEDCYLTGERNNEGKSAYINTIYVNGKNRYNSSGAGKTKGVRDLTIRNVATFASEINSMKLDNVNNALISGAFFEANGKSRIEINGLAHDGAGGDKKSSCITINASFLADLFVKNCTSATIIHSGNLLDYKIEDSGAVRVIPDPKNP